MNEYRNKEWLEREYIVNGKSTLDIGEQFGITHWAIGLWLRKHGIKTRDPAEATRRPRARAKISEARWRGGRRNQRGYVYVMSLGHPYGDKNGYVQEHRLVMEEHLGRILSPKEVVHHINGITTDNRLENLIVMEKHNHLQAHRWHKFEVAK